VDKTFRPEVEPVGLKRWCKRGSSLARVRQLGGSAKKVSEESRFSVRDGHEGGVRFGTM